MLERIQPLHWSHITITCQSPTHHFDFKVAHLDVSVDNYEHDTMRLTCKFINAMPPLLTELSESVIKKRTTQHTKNFHKERSSDATLLIDKMESLRLLPCYPEKPLVLELQDKLDLCPHSKTLVFAFSLANIVLIRDTSIVHTWNLLETPKKTLYGDPTTGVVSFTVQENFITDEAAMLKIAKLCPLCIIHPIHIINKTDKTMPIKELLINFSQISIFEHDGILSSECIRYEYNSDRVQISTEPQSKHKNSVVIQKPVKPEASLVLQGLQFFKNIVGF